MKIKAKLCEGLFDLEKFLNDELDYNGFRPENVILGMSQDRNYYTIIYKDFKQKD